MFAGEGSLSHHKSIWTPTFVKPDAWNSLYFPINRKGSSLTTSYIGCWPFPIWTATTWRMVNVWYNTNQTHHYIRGIDVVSAFHSRKWCQANPGSLRWKENTDTLNRMQQKYLHWLISNSGWCTVFIVSLSFTWQPVLSRGTSKAMNYMSWKIDG